MEEFNNLFPVQYMLKYLPEYHMYVTHIRYCITSFCVLKSRHEFGIV